MQTGPETDSSRPLAPIGVDRGRRADPVHA